MAGIHLSYSKKRKHKEVPEGMYCPYYKGNQAAEEHVKVNTVILEFTLQRMNVETTTEEAENMQCDKTDLSL